MRRSHIVWGSLLIIIGILWILASSGMVPFDIMGAIRTLWPVFIVAAGITLLLKKEDHVMKAVVWVLAIALVGGYGIYLGNAGHSLMEEGNDHVFELKDGMEHAKMEVNTGTTSIRIGSADSALARVSSNIKGLRHNYKGGRDSTIRFYQRWEPLDLGSGRNFYANLSKDVRWDLELNTGAIDGIIDFSGFPLENCEINTGTCDLRIVAGNLQDETTVKCNGGAVSMSISIPEGTGIRIVSNAAVNDIGGNGITIEKKGKYYESSNFDSADRFVYLHVNSGASNITVNVL